MSLRSATTAGSPRVEDLVGEDEDWVSLFSSWRIILETGSKQASQIAAIDKSPSLRICCGLWTARSKQTLWVEIMVGEHTNDCGRRLHVVYAGLSHQAPTNNI